MHIQRTVLPIAYKYQQILPIEEDVKIIKTIIIKIRNFLLFLILIMIMVIVLL